MFARLTFFGLTIMLVLNTTSTVEYFTYCGVEVTFILLTIKARQGEALNSRNEVHQLVWIKCLSRYQKNGFFLIIVE